LLQYIVVGRFFKITKIMSAKQEAIELVEKYKDYVHGYVGSSMLTNYEYPEQTLSQAKKVAIITIDEKIKTCNKFYEKLSFPAEVKSDMGYICFKKELDYLNEVKKEVENLTA